MIAMQEQQSGSASGHSVPRERTLATIKRLKAEIEQRTSFLFDGMALNIEDALFEEMHGMEEQSALRSHFNIMRAFRLQSELFRDEFKVLMNVCWVNLLNQKDHPPLKAPDAATAALIRRLAVKTELRHKALGDELTQRFSRLAGHRVEDHPLTPGNLFLAFWFSVQRLSLTEDEKKLLLPLFDRFVMDRIGPVLALANANLDRVILG